ncbi:hypothetical protein O3Q52_30990 [Streptomyces sp. ActVer]|uniref:hypothetical protein n=1 Tax=Streptomyces sp. ActVer TaxID=3014558 RepID=UPI0022B39999|nr:hypothetical protein [Streptomyces sp. ActVer]MCZ4512515.1 hypothetical protein [Streptomyces sp. ActVer]
MKSAVLVQGVGVGEDPACDGSGRWRPGPDRLHIHDGAFSATDLTARHPRTGELLSTVKFMVQTHAGLAVHRQFLARCQPLDGVQGSPAVPAQLKARREYENRVSTLVPLGP